MTCRGFLCLQLWGVRNKSAFFRVFIVFEAAIVKTELAEDDPSPVAEPASSSSAVKTELAEVDDPSPSSPVAEPASSSSAAQL